MIIGLSFAFVSLIVLSSFGELTEEASTASLAIGIVVALVFLASLIAGPIWGGIRVGRRLHRNSPLVNDDHSLSISETMENAVVCPNCGRERHGKFCAACGQNDRDYRRLFPVLSDIVAETFEADSRVWRTLRALLFRPGFLSLEFVSNRRASYINPFRLYLFASIPVFLVSAYFNLRSESKPNGNTVGNSEPTTATLSDPLSFEYDLFYEFVPLTLLFIIPVFALLLQFIFIDRRAFAEHFVFVLHFQSVGFFILLLFLPWFFSGDSNGWQAIAFLIPLGAYMFFALKRFYGSGTLRTLCGWVAFMVVYCVLFMGALALTAIIAALLSGQDISSVFMEEP